MMDPTALGLATAALEKAVDGALRYDPGTRTALAELAGKVIAVDSTMPELTLYLYPQSADSSIPLRVHAFSEDPADTRLSGNLPAILRLTFGTQHSLAGSGVTVTGDSGLLSRLQDILHHLDIDWEEPVTALLGNTLGHGLAQMMRRQADWTRGSASRASRFTADYLTEELRVTPSEAEQEVFFEDVEDLRSATDRLGARIQRLKQYLAESQGE